MADKGNDSDIPFLADECVFVRTVNIIRELGFTVHELSEFDLLGAKDPVVLQKAQDLDAVLITNDQGFGDIQTYPPFSHRGIVVLKMTPDPEQIASVHSVLKELLSTEEAFKGTLFIVDHNKYRKRNHP